MTKEIHPDLRHIADDETAIEVAKLCILVGAFK